MSEPTWPSGVGGAQCDRCYQTTIVRSFAESDFDDDPEWLCRSCYEGYDECAECERGFLNMIEGICVNCAPSLYQGRNEPPPRPSTE